LRKPQTGIVLHEVLTRERLLAQLLIQKAKMAEDGRLSAVGIAELIAVSSAKDWAVNLRRPFSPSERLG
jgi:hypothetical protein